MLFRLFLVCFLGLGFTGVREALAQHRATQVVTIVVRERHVLQVDQPGALRLSEQPAPSHVSFSSSPHGSRVTAEFVRRMASGGDTQGGPSGLTLVSILDQETRLETDLRPGVARLLPGSDRAYREKRLGLGYQLDRAHAGTTGSPAAVILTLTQ